MTKKNSKKFPSFVGMRAGGHLFAFAGLSAGAKFMKKTTLALGIGAALAAGSGCNNQIPECDNSEIDRFEQDQMGGCSDVLQRVTEDAINGSYIGIFHTDSTQRLNKIWNKADSLSQVWFENETEYEMIQKLFAEKNIVDGKNGGPEDFAPGQYQTYPDPNGKLTRINYFTSAFNLAVGEDVRNRTNALVPESNNRPEIAFASMPQGEYPNYFIGQNGHGMKINGIKNMLCDEDQAKKAAFGELSFQTGTPCELDMARLNMFLKSECPNVREFAENYLNNDK